MTPTRDPALWTLSEALAEAPARRTLVWGDAPRPGDLDGAGPIDLLADRLAEGVRREDVAALPAPEAHYERICLRIPRAKRALVCRLRVSLGHLAPGGEIWVAGHTQDGIKAASSAFPEALGAATVLRTKRHCRVVAATVVGAPPAAPTLDDVAARFTVDDAARGPLAVCSLPGVFSDGRVDAGTARLLSVIAGEQLRFKRGVDLGAGAGLIGAALLRARPQGRMTLIDSSATACAAAERTLAANGLDATVRLGDARDVETDAYDLAVSNPPRHVARAHAHDLTVAFAEAAHRALSRHGVYYCVANHDKALTRALERFFALEVRHHDRSFRVWKATR